MTAHNWFNKAALALIAESPWEISDSKGFKGLYFLVYFCCGMSKEIPFLERADRSW